MDDRQLSWLTGNGWIYAAISYCYLRCFEASMLDDV